MSFPPPSSTSSSSSSSEYYYSSSTSPSPRKAIPTTTSMPPQQSYHPQETQPRQVRVMATSSSSSSPSSEVAAAATEILHQESTRKRNEPKGIFDSIMSSSSNDSFVLTSRLYSHRTAMHRPVRMMGGGDNTALPNLTRLCLPYPQPWTPTAGPAPDALPPDFSFLTNSCGGKAAVGVFGGGIMVRLIVPLCLLVLFDCFVLCFVCWFNCLIVFCWLNAL